MTEQQRWRSWTRSIGASLIAGVALTMVALALRSRALMLASIAVMALTGVTVFGVTLYARRRPDLLVPPHMQGMDPDGRRLVTTATEAGVRADDPRLAATVVAHARRQLTGMAFLILSGALPVGGRIADLTSQGTDSTPFDVLVIAFWLVAAGAIAHRILRLRRAIVANRPDVG